MATITTNTVLSDITITNGEAITISNNARLTINATPANRPGTITCNTIGELYVTNSSLTTPLVLTLNSNTNDFIFNGQGKFTIRGLMIDIYTGNGASNQTIDFSSIGGVLIDYPPFVWVETGSGTNIYEKFININLPGDASALDIATNFGAGIHGQVFTFNTTTRVATFGNGTNGKVIPNGARVKYPNIHITSNVDNAAVASKTLVDLDPTGTADWENVAFSERVYLGSQCTGASGVRVVNVGAIGLVSFSNTIFSVDIDGLVVCPYRQSATSGGLNLVDCPTTIKVKNCAVMSNNVDSLILTRVATLLELKDNILIVTKRSTANSEPIIITSVNNFIAGKNTLIGGKMNVSYCSNIEFEEILHSDQTSGANSTLVPTDAITWTGVVNGLIRKITLAGAAVRTSILRLLGDCDNIVAIEIEWDCQNQTQYIVNSNGANVTIGRSENLIGTLRTGVSPTADLAKSLRLVGVRNSGAGAIGVVTGGRYEWVSGAPPTGLSGGAAGFGPYSLLLDAVTGTAGKLVLGPMTPETDNEYITLTGGAFFNQLGAVFFPSIGDSITVTTWYPLKWIQSFSGTATKISVEDTDLSYEVRIKNASDSNWTAWTPFVDGGTLNTLLGTLSGYSASLGLDISFRITSINTNSALKSFSQLSFACTRVPDGQYDPVLQFTKVGVSGAEEGSLLAVLNNDDPMNPFLIGSTTVDGTGTATIDCPYRFLTARNVIIRVRKPGFEPIVINTSYTNANVIIPVTQIENLDIAGGAVYGRGTGTTSSLVSFDPANLRVDIGNGRVVAEDLYDTVAEWQATLTGSSYPEVLKFDGRDILLKNGWKFRRKLAGDVNASLDALPVVEGDVNSSPDDEVNGSIDFGARSVRVLSTGTIDTAAIAAAVWSYNNSVPVTGTTGEQLEAASAGGSGGGLDAAEVRAAIGLSSANLDSQLSTIDSNIDSILVDTDVTIPSLITGLSIPSAVSIANEVWTAATRSLTDKTNFTLTAGERNSIATAVEAAIINEGDGQQVIDAILQVFNSNLDLPALELTAIANAVRSELATELGRIDVAISSREAEVDANTRANTNVSEHNDTQTLINSLNDLSISDIRTSLGMATANLDSQLNSLNTLITNLNNLSALDISNSVSSILNTYDPPTKAELDTAESNIIAALSSSVDIPTLVNAIYNDGRSLTKNKFIALK